MWRKVLLNLEPGHRSERPEAARTSRDPSSFHLRLLLPLGVRGDNPTFLSGLESKIKSVCMRLKKRNEPVVYSAKLTLFVHLSS